MYGLKKNIYVCWYEARFSYQMRFVLFKSDMTGVISKICSSNSFESPDTSGFQWVLNVGSSPGRVKPKCCEIGICSFSGKHTSFRIKTKWSDMSTRGLLIQRASTIEI